MNKDTHHNHILDSQTFSELLTRESDAIVEHPHQIRSFQAIARVRWGSLIEEHHVEERFASMSEVLSGRSIHATVLG